MEKIKGTFFENTTIIIDTTECKVNTSLAGFYSGYKKEYTIKYEVGIGSVNQKFVWAPIPGLPGPDADQDSYKFYKLAEQIGDNEEILGDGHYVGQNKSVIKTMKQYQIYRKEFGEVRAAVKI